MTALACVALGAAAPPSGSLDTSEPLFTVLAALEAVGRGDQTASTFRGELASALRQAEFPSKRDLQRFVDDHAPHRADGTVDQDAELRQYLSFALCLSDAPSFSLRLKGAELPPDAASLSGFETLLTRFYDEAAIGPRWRAAQPSYQRQLGILQEPIIESVGQVNAYLRNPTSGYLGRRFQIDVELLLPPGEVQTRSYGNEYFVLIGPGLAMLADAKGKAEAERAEEIREQARQIRHAYLHFLLDPVATKYAEPIGEKRDLAAFTEDAPFLPASYKQDFLLLVTECLIKAIETRLPGREPGMDALQAAKQGYVLTQFFAESLPKYEKQERAFRLYFPDLWTLLDAKREQRRLNEIVFDTQPPAQKRRSVTIGEESATTPAARLMEEGERALQRKDASAARGSYELLLRSVDARQLHAEAYYGLARAALLAKDPDQAQRFFEKALTLDPTPITKAWLLVYLGQLALATTDEDKADVSAKYLRQALAIPEISKRARDAAERTLERLPKELK